VSVGGEAYVLRIAGAGTHRYIDRAAEARNAGLAASIGIAPQVLHLDPQRGLMLTRFIAGGAPLQAAELRRPELLRSAVGLLKRLHGSGLVFAGRMDLFPKLDEYIALAAQKGCPDGLDLRPLSRQAEAARAALEGTEMPFVPSHVDPVPHNFVHGSSALYLLDWEYAAMAEPMWDLAAVSIEAELDAALDRILLDEYFGSAGLRHAGRFALYKASLNLIAAAWAVVQIVDGNPARTLPPSPVSGWLGMRLRPRPPPTASTLRASVSDPIVIGLNGVPSWLRGARPAGRRQPDEPDPDNAGGGM